MVLLGVAALCCPAIASAWEVSSGTQGILIHRDVSVDTTTSSTTVTVYHDYRGEGGIYTPTHSLRTITSYRKSIAYSGLFDPGTYLRNAQIPYPPDGYEGYALVHLSGSGTNAGFVVYCAPQSVREVDPVELVSVEGSVAVSTMPSMSLDTTSLAVHSDSEITVAPNEALSAFALIATVALGLVVAKGWRP